MTEEQKYNDIFERGQRGEFISAADSNFIARLHYEDTKNKIHNLMNPKK